MSLDIFIDLIQGSDKQVNKNPDKARFFKWAKSMYNDLFFDDFSSDVSKKSTIVKMIFNTWVGDLDDNNLFTCLSPDNEEILKMFNYNEEIIKNVFDMCRKRRTCIIVGCTGIKASKEYSTLPYCTVHQELKNSNSDALTFPHSSDCSDENCPGLMMGSVKMCFECALDLNFHLA